MGNSQADDDDKMTEKGLRGTDYDEKSWNRVSKELKTKTGQDGKIKSSNVRFNGSHRMHYE